MSDEVNGGRRHQRGVSEEPSKSGFKLTTNPADVRSFTMNVTEKPVRAPLSVGVCDLSHLLTDFAANWPQ